MVLRRAAFAEASQGGILETAKLQAAVTGNGPSTSLNVHRLLTQTDSSIDARQQFWVSDGLAGSYAPKQSVNDVGQKSASRRSAPMLTFSCDISPKPVSELPTIHPEPCGTSTCSPFHGRNSGPARRFLNTRRRAVSASRIKRTICDIRISQEESHGALKSRVLYAVFPVLPLPASLSFNSARTLRSNSIGRNGFSR